MSAIPETLAQLRVPIESLKPYPGNAKRHDLETLRASLRRHRQYRPVVVQESTRFVLAGNGTLAAAIAEGWDEIAATFIDCDDEQARRINLIDNRAHRPEHEFCLYCRPDVDNDHGLCIYCKGETWEGGRGQSDVWEVARDTGYVHPTQKPVALAERALTNSTRPGGLVLDLFGGSGSTMLACENLNRRAHLVELDPGYCDVIVDRWQRHTGQQAEVQHASD